MKNVLSLIGDTPLIELKKFSNPNARLFAKLEMFNPTHSIKDRIVSHIIHAAEHAGILKPGMTIIEATSGNTGAALAMIASMKVYSVILTTPGKTSPEKIAVMRSYGADVRVCPAAAKEGDPENYITLAKAIHQQTPNSFMLNQYNNPANIAAHYASTGPEIWEQMEGKVDYLIACGSSGGTITGVGRYLKERNPALKVIMPDPIGSIYYSYFKTKKMNPDHIKPYKTEGVGKDFICDCMDFSILDDVIQFTDEDAFSSVKKLALEEGILAGGSSGAALFAANQLASQLTEPAHIVVIFPDSGLKYVSTIFTA